MVQADDHRCQPLGEVAQEARELGGQRDQEPGVDEIQEGLDHQRAEERHRQAMGEEGDTAATTASHRHLAHLSRSGEIPSQFGIPISAKGGTLEGWAIATTYRV